MAASFVRSVRTMHAGDTLTAADWIARSSPLSETLARSLPTLLHSLFVEGGLTGVVVEYIHDHDPKPELAAFGLTGFPSEVFIKEHLASPKPHIELVLLERALHKPRDSTFLTHAEIAQANAGEGLTLAPIIWRQHTTDVTNPEAQALLNIAHQSLLQRHRGYRIARIVKEMPTAWASVFLGAGFREHCRFAAGTPLDFLEGATLEQDNILFIATRAEASWPSSAIDHLFMYDPPRCLFTRAEQQVLVGAVDGLTDGKIAQQLEIPITAVTMRWRSIYARLIERAPHVLRAEEEVNGGRGEEKRRKAIAFVSEHPEELRPYATAPRRQRRVAR
jgi:hypothetical protein